MTMKKLRNFLGENTTAYPYKVVLVFPEMNLNDVDHFIQVSELLDESSADIKYDRVQDTSAMVEVLTKIDVFEDMIDFSDKVLERIREEDIRVNVTFAEKR